MTDLPQGWAEVRVEQLAANEPSALTDGPFGANLKTSHYSVNGPRVIRLQNIASGRFVDERAHIPSEHFEKLRRHEARAGDVVVAMLGDDLPRACVVPASVGPAIVKADCARLRVHPDLAIASYVAYALNSERLRQQAASLIHGVGRPRLGLKWLRTLLVPLAPPREQRKIVGAIESYFSRLDDAVANLERVQRNLKRYRASVLQAAIEGRLVPAEAELARAEGRDYEPATVLLERILGQRLREWRERDAAGSANRARARRSEIERERLDHATLPALPEGWCWSSVGQLGLVSGGITKNSTRERLPLHLPYLRVANVYANELRLDEVKRIGVSEAEARRTELAPGDLLIVEGNGSVEQIGRVAVWNGRIERCVHQNHLIRVRFSPVALADWVLTWLLSPAGRVAIEQVASSTAGLHTLSLSKVAKLPVPLPPAAEQARVLAEVDLLLTLDRAWASSVAGSVSRCRAARQSILRWAFDGVLVDQDPNEEPASVLLGRIAASRGAKVPDGRRRRRREVANR